MKKPHSFIPFFFMFIVLTVLVVYMCLPISQVAISAEAGTLELETFDDSVYALDGQWQFYYGELLNPEKISESLPALIKVPSLWNQSGYPDSGVATYHLEIRTKADHPLLLYVPETLKVCNLWANGALLHCLNPASATSSQASFPYENGLIPINAENGIIDITLQIDNFDLFEGGITHSLLLGDYNALMSWFMRIHAFYYLALGCILIMAFYHFTLYVFRNREGVYLWFALLCLACFIRFLFETGGLNDNFHMITDLVFIGRFFAVIWVLHAYLITYFTLVLLESELLKKWFVRRHIYLAIAILPFLFLPLRSVLFTTSAAILFLTPALFTVVLIWKSPKRKENPFMLMYFASYVLFLIIGSTSKIIAHDFFMPGLIANMFLMMTQVILLSQNYACAFTFVEETNANLERIVDERTRSLQDTNAAMQELVSNISHDLKTPLAILSLNLEALSGLAVTQSDAYYQHHVRAAYQKSLDLQRLIQNLFEINRIETGRNLYSVQWLPVLPLLAQAKEKYDDFLEDQGLHFDIAVEADIEIRTDPVKIWSVFDNIIYNGARYTESGGSITIVVHGKEVPGDSLSEVTVTITDTGCGIAPEHMPHIFERFYKGSKSRNTQEGDSGLGLYIVKSIMEGCGGSVIAKSKQNQGTSIILTFSAR